MSCSTELAQMIALKYFRVLHGSLGFLMNAGQEGLTLTTLRCLSSRWKAQPHWSKGLAWHLPSSSAGQLGQALRPEWAWILPLRWPSCPQRLQPAPMRRLRQTQHVLPHMHCCTHHTMAAVHALASSASC